MPEGCWKVKYKILYLLNFIFSLIPYFLAVNRRLALDFLLNILLRFFIYLLYFYYISLFSC